MGKSKISIRELEEGYRFEVIPSNNRIPLAISPTYKTYRECENAKKNFCEFVLANKLDNLKSPFTEVFRKEDKKVPQFYYAFYDSNRNMVLYRKLGYYKRCECIKGIARVYKIVVENA